jgi:hypothetical protein
VGFFAVNVTTVDQSGIEITTGLADGKYEELISGTEIEISGGVVKTDLAANQAIALIKR